MKAERESEVPVSLPLLEAYGQQIDIEHLRPFEGYTILAIQHLLGSSIPLFEMLERGGARPKDIHIIGKAYSSHPAVVDLLIRKGYNLTLDDVFSNESDQPYDAILEKHILAACNKMAEVSDTSPKNHFLIIDDGGKAIKLVQDSFSTKAHFVGVEQTSRGARLLSPLALSFPVVNVARSEAKTIHESPMIAKAMVYELMVALDRWAAEDVLHIEDKNVLLLGYGYVGECVAKELTDHGFHVVAYDPDPEKAARAAQNTDISFISDRKQAYANASLIVGCTGTSSIPPDEFRLIRPGTLLASMASTDTEFRAWNLRSGGAIVHTTVLPSDEQYLARYFPLPWRSLYQCQAGDTYFYLANGGFPMDFSGSVNPVPAENIQLTSTLLLAAAVQAIGTAQSGLIEFDQDTQSAIISQYAQSHPLNT